MTLQLLMSVNGVGVFRSLCLFRPVVSHQTNNCFSYHHHQQHSEEKLVFYIAVMVYGGDCLTSIQLSRPEEATSML